MRLLAHIAAFAIIIFVGYLLVRYGYPSFVRRTNSHVIAQFMMFVCLGFAALSVIYAVRKMP
jgi:Kef-type K+ transport system membrane component KefB